MNTVAGTVAGEDVLPLVRNSVLAVELTGDQCAVLALESLLEREPVIVYRVMRAILRVVHVVINRMAMHELTNYLYKVHGKY
jgi:hypothetical protein